MDLLGGLEDKVDAVRRSVAALRKENRSLRAKVRRLEARLAEGAEAAGSGWSAERDEIRRRVTRLSEHLEKLLQE